MSREEIAKVLELWDSGQKELATALLEDFDPCSEYIVEIFRKIMDGLEKDGIREWKALWVSELINGCVFMHTWRIIGVDLQGDWIHTQIGGRVKISRILRIT